VSISDTGLGIPEDQQAEMFNNFFRGRNVEQKGITGTGLGLFIIKIIIEGTGGRIFFTSTEGVGTTFYIVLETALI
jgi:signal transduction histidine kinase